MEWHAAPLFVVLFVLLKAGTLWQPSVICAPVETPDGKYKL
jgi:hypothetical protein